MDGAGRPSWLRTGGVTTGVIANLLAALKFPCTSKYRTMHCRVRRIPLRIFAVRVQTRASQHEFPLVQACAELVLNFDALLAALESLELAFRSHMLLYFAHKLSQILHMVVRIKYVSLSVASQSAAVLQEDLLVEAVGGDPSCGYNWFAAPHPPSSRSPQPTVYSAQPTTPNPFFVAPNEMRASHARSSLLEQTKSKSRTREHMKLTTCASTCVSTLTVAARSLAWAIMSTNSAASLLHRPPVSVPTTTYWQRPPSKSSEYFAAFSTFARWSTAPLVCAAFVHGRAAVVALRNVMSTASLSPMMERRTRGHDLNSSLILDTDPDVQVSKLCVATHGGTGFTTYPCGVSPLWGVALVCKRPDRGHAARCRPRMSNLAQQTHVAPVGQP